MREVIMPLLTIALVLLLSLIVADVVGKTACEQRWQHQGSYWGFFTGCMVKTPDGTFLPESNYRIID